MRGHDEIRFVGRMAGQLEYGGVRLSFTLPVSVLPPLAKRYGTIRSVAA